ncbi:thioesterase II family protein [Streptomyces cyaneofuscatus]|uniref:thioesterase II family protein n=1 Tax=Streptomyces cyaneofuscatus TaxID=66883 RepID=UPI0033AC23A4
MWVREPDPGHEDRARPRLFCFPFAGGGAHAFRSWPSGLAEVAEVLPVRLPGRDERHREPLPTDIDVLAGHVADGLADWCRAPYALYGHSMGAQLAYRFVHTMAERGLPLPDLLIVAAHRAPHQPPTLPLTYSLPRDAFVARLREFGATPAPVLDNAEMLDFFLPIIRSDFALSELSPKYDHGRPLGVPILALGGKDDQLVSRDQLDAWSWHTTSRFQARQFPGGHFFQAENEGQVMELISAELRRLGTGSGRS